jgi:hypothetical protein
MGAIDSDGAAFAAHRPLFSRLHTECSAVRPKRRMSCRTRGSGRVRTSTPTSTRLVRISRPSSRVSAFDRLRSAEARSTSCATPPSCAASSTTRTETGPSGRSAMHSEQLLDDRMYAAAAPGGFGCPRGVWGALIGYSMARTHRSRNRWMLSRLDLHGTDRVLEIGCGPGAAVRDVAKSSREGSSQASIRRT